MRGKGRPASPVYLNCTRWRFFSTPVRYLIGMAPDPVLDALDKLTAEVRSLRAAVVLPLVDVEAAAKHLSVSTRTVRRLVRDKAIPFKMVGRYPRFDLSLLRV